MKVCKLMEPELHLFIIWKNARKIQERILEDIGRDLEIVKVIEVKWGALKFSENLMRFYGTKLHRWSFKERECGNGAFLLILVHDHNPKYLSQRTSRGIDEVVNITMFDKKQKYRQWLGGNNAKVHATNSVEETRHDLMLLLGLTIEEFESKYKTLPERLNQDIIGSRRWESLDQIFKVLNETSRYVVLRNYEYLPDQYSSKEHGDIDLLVQNEKDVAYLLNARKVFRQTYRVHYVCKVDQAQVKFDFRSVGDGYYDSEWEKKILEDRRMSGPGFYIPCEEDYKYSLLYHALIHKKSVADDYRLRLSQMFSCPDLQDELFSFLHHKGYEVTEPDDYSVFINEANAGIEMSKERRAYNDRLRKKQLLVRLIKKV